MDSVLARLKSAPAWTMIIGIVNLALSILGATPQVTQLVNAVVVLVAFVLFGVQVGQVIVQARRATRKMQ